MRLLLFCFFLVYQTIAFGAFPIATGSGKVAVNDQVAKTAPVKSVFARKSTPFKGDRSGGTYSIISVVCALLSFGACAAGYMVLAGTLYLSAPAWLIPIILGLSLSALFFGLAGMKRKLKGVAAAGLWMGAIELTTLVFALFAGLISGTFSQK